MTSVETQLEEARRSLLDISLWNKLLNFREYKRSRARVVDEIPAEIYQHLVLDENSMTFQLSEAHPTASPRRIVEAADAVEVLADGHRHEAGIQQRYMYQR